MLPNLGLVVIGRNEGDRLKQCLRSVLGQIAPIVYVDSGSTDNSVEFARSLGIEVVELDMTIPFTAARARNEGFKQLQKRNEHLEFVQFVDGDCEIVPLWLETAEKALQANSKLAVVCGRRRERFPEKNPFNRLCDLEWDTPVGQTRACGGDAMMRIADFQKVGGFNGELIAGEEPELCIRLRQQGGQIERLAAEMTLHDADIKSWRQWWKRSVRAGHSFAQVSALYPPTVDLEQRRQKKRSLVWGLILPVIILVLLWPTRGLSLLLLAGYGLLVFKIYRNQRDRGLNASDSLFYACFCCLARFPELQGQLTFYFNTWRGQTPRLIEYKNA